MPKLNLPETLNSENGRGKKPVLPLTFSFLLPIEGPCEMNRGTFFIDTGIKVASQMELEEGAGMFELKLLKYVAGKL